MHALQVLLTVNAILLLMALWVVHTFRSLIRKGDDMNRITKSLAISLAGLIGARIARNLVRRVL